MVSFRTTAIGLAAALAVSADYYIDPNTVGLPTRQKWCLDMTSTCPLICQSEAAGRTRSNECNPTSLQYSCVCSNGLQPNVSEYSLTIPFYTCQEWGNQCVKACKNDNLCARDCREKHLCGAQNPQKLNTSASATTTAGPGASPTSDPNQIYTDVGGSGAQTQNSAATVAAMGSPYGLGFMAGVLFFSFTCLI